MSLRRLKNYLSTSLSCVRARLCWGISMQVAGEERIMRTIFHPANYNEKKGTLKSNFMKPPVEADEDDPTITSNKLSVTRYDYSGLEFCRAHAYAHQKPPRRNYWGFGRFVVNELTAPCIIEDQAYTCSVEPKPVDDNPAHANINLGFRTAVGVPLDGQVQEYIKKLADSAEVLPDPNPNSSTWTGQPVDGAKYRELNYKPKE